MNQLLILMLLVLISPYRWASAGSSITKEEKDALVRQLREKKFKGVVPVTRDPEEEPVLDDEGNPITESEPSDGMKLQERINALHQRGDCGVTAESGWTVPIPAYEKGKRVLKVVYYHHDRAADGKSLGISPPFTVFALPPDPEGKSTCAKLKADPKARFGPYMSPAARAVYTAGMIYDLLDQTLTVAQLYFKKAAGPEVKVVVEKYFKDFTFRTQPGMKVIFMELNPDFWNWVEAQTGNKLVPVKK